MYKSKSLGLALLCLGLTACLGAPELEDETDEAAEVLPGGHGHVTAPEPELGTAAEALSSNSPVTGAMTNHGGGGVMTSGANVYLIWYGNWSGNTATSILPDFVSYLGGSSWYAINTTYYDTAGNHVPNSVTYAGSTTDAYSQGTSLSDDGVKAVVSRAISTGALPADANGAYFVLSSADVAETNGFCTLFCGEHFHATVANKDIKYAFVGNGDRCPSGCQAQTKSPNANAGADGMASVLAHELSEMVTDPDLNTWYDASGNENADKCAWSWGSTYQASNGSYANLHLGTRDYLIQQNWVNMFDGYCAMSYTYGTPPSGTTVSVKAYTNSKYVCAENAGSSSLIANRSAVGPWETFQFIDLGNHYFALKAYTNSKYVCAENAGSSSLIANRSAIGPWETFRWDLP